FSLLLGLRLCIKYRIDIIHAHSIFAAFFGLILGRIFNIKVVGSPHGIDTYKYVDSYVGNKIIVYIIFLLDKLTWPKLNKVVFDSEFQLKQAQNNLGFLPNAEVISSGIKDAGHLKKESEFLKEKLDILYCGRLAPVKSLDKLILSFNFLSKEILDNISLVIVGDGYEVNNLKQLVKKHDLESRISFTGFISNAEVEENYRKADVFILPSENESFPVALLEAMSFGIPCISKSFGLPFRKDSVYFINDNAPETIAQAIETLYKGPDLRIKMSKNALEESKTNYSFDKVVENHIKLYENLLK
ncbi:glycosyltransferase family 4 protein, partial [Thermodesulfobacteriota bacterium]